MLGFGRDPCTTLAGKAGLGGCSFIVRVPWSFLTLIKSQGGLAYAGFGTPLLNKQNPEMGWIQLIHKEVQPTLAKPSVKDNRKPTLFMLICVHVCSFMCMHTVWLHVGFACPSIRYLLSVPIVTKPPQAKWSGIPSDHFMVLVNHSFSPPARGPHSNQFA